MTCHETTSLLVAYLEGSLAGPQLEEFERHAATCAKCSARLSEMREAVAALRGSRDDSVSPEQREKLLELFRKWKAEREIGTSSPVASKPTGHDDEAQTESLKPQLLPRKPSPIVWQRRLPLIAAVAAIVIIAVLVVLVRRYRHGVPGNEAGNQGQFQAYALRTVDLRGKSVVRGDNSIPDTRPVEISRERLALTIYLPIGSKAGNYQLQILDEQGKTAAATSGSAALQDHTMTLSAKLDLSKVPAGQYRLAIRPQGWDWSYFPLTLR